MKTIIRSAVTILLVTFTLASQANLSNVPSGEYHLDKTHAYLTYSYHHENYSFPEVGFNSFDVSLILNSKNPEKSSVKVVIDMTSINSRVEIFDERLQGEKFFDTEKFPQATFESTSIKSTGKDTYDVTGDLTIKDVTLPTTMSMIINLAAPNRKKIPTIGLSGSTKISRTAFGIGRSVPRVGDEVTITVSVELPMKK